MSTTPEQSQGESQQPSIFDTVADQYDPIAGTVFLAVGGALALTVVILASTKGYSLLTLDVWLGGLSIVFVGIGLARLLGPQTEAFRNFSPGDRLRLTALAAGGLLGFVTFIYGVLLIVLDYPSVFAGKIEVMRENVGTIMLCALPLFGGLVLMYLGLTLGYRFERTEPGLRRLLYGYNAVVGGLLLFAILGVVNLLAYTHVKPFSALGATLDWSGTGQFTLKEGSRQILADLKEPIEVKIILRANDPVTSDVELLLSNCRQVNPEVRWQIISPDEDETAYQELIKKYQVPGSGLLVVYGKPGAEIGEFIKRDDLLTSQSFDPRSPEREPEPVFQGEFALIKTLQFLEEGKTRTTLYFTQGNGELDYTDSFSKNRDKGMGALIEELGKGNYDLQQGPADKIPEKADVVVIAGPRKPLSEEALDAVRKYLKPGGGKKPGKLLVLFDVAVVNDKMVNTGLEKLVADYNVTVSDSMIYAVGRQNPREVGVIPHFESSNPVPKAFFNPAIMQVKEFFWYNVRAVQPAPPNPARSYATEVLFETDPRYGCWQEDDLGADPGELADGLRRDRQKLIQRIAKTPLPVAVAVSESSGGLPPGHPGVGGQKPVLIAFGDATWLSNPSIQSKDNMNLFTSCVAWLRERPEIGQMPEPPKRPTYEFNVTDDRKSQMYWVPGFLILLTIISLSLGVWLVRRR